jgi:hypothetical protein
MAVHQKHIIKRHPFAGYHVYVSWNEMSNVAIVIAWHKVDVSLG